ncbi:peroxiredoxin-like family protein [Sulfuriflexus mobilis]|uniref:peroxiredoxin-like family protein n=1 Tax=Sulfuriflexus mobilis TaxID=1811807 RepID=UPI000F81C189|nr:peroxiredoxin-like family protein [Sulfuriflexus mobilis]
MMTLQEQLEQVTNDTLPQLPAAILQKVDGGYRSMLDMELESFALGVNDMAPDFSLPNAYGEPQQLSELLRTGSVVLTFYRGIWCPYCQVQLRAYQKILPEMRENGAHLIAISPQVPDTSLQTQNEWQLGFEVLSDVKNVVAGRYGICYDIPRDHVDLLEIIGFSLEKNYEDERAILPLAATFVIDRGGYIRWCFVDRNYRKRAEPEAILAAIKALRT